MGVFPIAACDVPQKLPPRIGGSQRNETALLGIPEKPVNTRRTGTRMPQTEHSGLYWNSLDGGPGGSRTHGVLSEADYESAACNQHGVRPVSRRIFLNSELAADDDARDDGIAERLRVYRLILRRANRNRPISAKSVAMRRKAHNRRPSCAHSAPEYQAAAPAHNANAHKKGPTLTPGLRLFLPDLPTRSIPFEERFQLV
jgi:hypothetical protein